MYEEVKEETTAQVQTVKEDTKEELANNTTINE